MTTAPRPLSAGDRRVCLVTGAARGIGRSIALALAARGTVLYLTDRHSGAPVERPEGGTVEAAAAEARAGNDLPFQPSPFWELDPGHWANMFDSGVRSHDPHRRADSGTTLDVGELAHRYRLPVPEADPTATPSTTGGGGAVVVYSTTRNGDTAVHPTAATAAAR